MMDFLLFDKDENFTGYLQGVFVAKRKEEINGPHLLELVTDHTEVAKGYRIAYKDLQGLWHEYVVKEVEEVRADALSKTLFCEDSIGELIGDFIEDKRPQNVAANVALAVALEPTRWAVGTVDDLGLASTNFYNISALEAVQRVAQVWRGEIRSRIQITGTQITGRFVDVLQARGNDLGKRFTYTKDLETVRRTVHRDEVVTALYGFGKGEEVGDGYGRRITFASINDGVAYLENLEAKEIWGRNSSSGKVHVFGRVEFDDIEDPAELMAATQEKLEELSTPLTSYEAVVINLKALGFGHEGVELGDRAVVIDKTFTPELRVKARVVKIEEDLLYPDDTKINLGNYTAPVKRFAQQESYIDNFRSKQGVWDRSNVIGSDGTINAQFLNNLVDELNTRMNSQGGYVFISDEGKGLITYDAPSPETATMAIQLLGGAFRIANSKLPDGSFDWTTFGDGNGFLADVFIGGLLKGGKVNFDLTNGTLLIGNSVEDYWLWFDGSRLRINGEISSSSVIVGDETLEQTLINLGSQIEMIQGGGGNLLFNSNYGTYESPSDYWWSANGLVWLLYENRIASWTQHNALIDTWTDFESYDW